MASIVYKTVYLEQGAERIAVNIRESAKAKHIRISLSSIKGVELVVPQKRSLKSAINFLFSKEHLIRMKLKSYEKRFKQIAAGDKIPIYGQSHQIVFDELAREINIKDNNIIIPSKFKLNSYNVLKLFLTELLYTEITKYTLSYSGALGVRFNKITLKDTKSLWGSCSAKGNLTFSWRLIFAPLYVIEYLVVHELCHLIEMNHSSKFWILVKETYPQYEMGKLWLRKNGAMLHQIFGL